MFGRKKSIARRVGDVQNKAEKQDGEEKDYL
jgi:hypothetical protein